MRFVTVSYYRSGSSPFQRMLNSHSHIIARQEDLRTYKRTGMSVKPFLRNLYSNANRSGLAKGFKVQYDQIVDGFWEFVENNDVKVIHLIRRDLLETCLWFRKNHIGNTSGGMGPPLIVKGKVEAKIDWVLDHMIWLRERIEEIRPRADFTVYYKDFTNNRNTRGFYDTEVRKKLMAFLGVRDANIEIPLKTNVKNKRGRSEDTVINWDELVAEMHKKGIERYYSDKKK